MTDRDEILWSLSDVVTMAPDFITVASLEADASKGRYWPISGDETTKANKGAS